MLRIQRGLSLPSGRLSLFDIVMGAATYAEQIHELSCGVEISVYASEMSCIRAPSLMKLKQTQSQQML